MKPDISIYTDGSCLNKGSEFAPGGWAAVLENDHKQLRISGRECPTTNQRMELMAIIEGLHIPAHHEHPFRTNVNTSSGLT